MVMVVRMVMEGERHTRVDKGDDGDETATGIIRHFRFSHQLFLKVKNGVSRVREGFFRFAAQREDRTLTRVPKLFEKPPTLTKA